MKRQLLAVLAAVVAIGFAASTASAQCAYSHPKKAKKFQSDLVAAFISCGNPGGNEPNITTGGGVPGCQPPMTGNEQAGNPGNGWIMDPLAFQGKVQFKKKKACTGKVKGVPEGVAPCDPLNTILNPPGHADMEIQLKLKGVVDAGGPADGTGRFDAVVRPTLDDWTIGDVQIIDFPAGSPFVLEGGKASLKTSADAVLTALDLPSLSACTSLEILDIKVKDENGSWFAGIGVWWGS